MFKRSRLFKWLIRRRPTTSRLTFLFGFEIFQLLTMSQSYKCVRLMFILGVSFLVFADVMGLEENEEAIDDFDTGTAYYWQVLQTNSSTFWHLSMHGEPLPPEIEMVRPPSVEGDGFLEVFPLSDNVAQIYSNVFDLLPGATLELTYWNSDGSYPVRHTVLLVYNEYKQMDDETGIKPPIQSVLVYRAPLLPGEFSGWRTDLVDLKITEPSKIQIRIDGSILKNNETGLAVTKIAIKNGVGSSTSSTTSSTSSTKSSTSSTTTSSTLTEATSTIGSTLSHSTSTELTSTSSSLSSTPSSSSTSSTVIPTTIFSSTMSFTISTSSSNPSFVVSTTTTSSSPSTSLDTSTNPTDFSDTSTLPPPAGMMNQLRNVLIGVGVAILLLLFMSLLAVFCYKRHRRRAYLIESRRLESGIIRQVKQLDDYPPYKTDYDSPSNSSTNSTHSPKSLT